MAKVWCCQYNQIFSENKKEWGHRYILLAKNIIKEKFISYATLVTSESYGPFNEFITK